jgi:hypothetical protein
MKIKAILMAAAIVSSAAPAQSPPDRIIDEDATCFMAMTDLAMRGQSREDLAKEHRAAIRSFERASGYFMGILSTRYGDDPLTQVVARAREHHLSQAADAQARVNSCYRRFLGGMERLQRVNEASLKLPK